MQSAEIIRAPYGYAMMANSPTGRNTFNVKLLTYTHYSGTMSKLFREVDIIQNSNCTSLSRNVNLEENSQDQLAASFICESRLRIVRFCLKPHIDISFDDYAPKVTSERTGKPGILQFNDFNLTVYATNDYTLDGVNEVAAPLNIRYQLLPCDRTDVLTYIIMAVTVIISMGLFLFIRSKSAKCDEKEKEK